MMPTFVAPNELISHANIIERSLGVAQTFKQPVTPTEAIQKLNRDMAQSTNPYLRKVIEPNAIVSAFTTLTNIGVPHNNGYNQGAALVAIGVI